MWAFRGSRHRLGNPSAAGDMALDELPSGYADNPCSIIRSFRRRLSQTLFETEFANCLEQRGDPISFKRDGIKTIGRNSRMSTPVFSGLMGALFLLGISAPVEAESRAAIPTLDVEAGCRDVDKMELRRTQYSSCITEEREARTQLENEWPSFSETAHEQCMHLVTEPALPSYVTLQECLHMRQDAKK